MWRILAILPIMLLTAAAPLPTPGEISDAVASVNDWRALGIFFLSFFIIREMSAAWSARQRRLDEKEDKLALAASIDNLTEKVSRISDATIQHNARTENIMARVDRLLMEQGL